MNDAPPNPLLQITQNAFSGVSVQADAPPLRLLVLQPLAFAPLDPSVVACVSDPEQAHDLVYLPQPLDRGMFASLVAVSANPAAPVIAHDADYGRRADVRIAQSGPGDLLHAATQLAPLCEQVSKLPAIPRGAERDPLLALTLALSRQTPLQAQWAPNQAQMIDYGLLLGVAQQKDLLERLANLGLMKRQYFERLHCCGSCGGSRIHAREVCSRCCSSDLAEHQLLHHYTCGLQAPEPVFQRDGGYECPKCRQPFRHYGVDYDKPGQVISCSACDASISEPDVFFVCADCGEQTDSEQAQAQSWYHYELTAQGVAAVQAGVLPMRQADANPLSSLQDFKVMVQNYVHIAQRVSRPLTLVRFDLRAAQGHSLERGLHQLYTLVMETARKGDVVTLADGCVLACLPETDASQVQPLLDRVARLVDEQLAREFDVIPHVIPRDRALAMLRALG